MRFHLVVACIAVALAVVDAGGWGQSCRDAHIDVYKFNSNWFANLYAYCKEVDGHYTYANIQLGNYITNSQGNLAVRRPFNTLLF
jgi:hypothetical protein